MRWKVKLSSDKNTNRKLFFPSGLWVWLSLLRIFYSVVVVAETDKHSIYINHLTLTHNQCFYCVFLIIDIYFGDYLIDNLFQKQQLSNRKSSNNLVSEIKYLHILLKINEIKMLYKQM